MNRKDSNPINLITRSGNQGTHSVPLAITCLNTSGPVLELGCGAYSTPLLHVICGKQARQLHTVDHNLRWLLSFSTLQTNWHTFEHLPSPWFNHYLIEAYYRLLPIRRRMIDRLWDQVGNRDAWGLVFIDHLPVARRKKDIERLRASTAVFVVHNTDRIGNSLFGFWPYFNTFRYLYQYPVTPATVVCSDSVNVRSFFE